MDLLHVAFLWEFQRLFYKSASAVSCTGCYKEFIDRDKTRGLPCKNLTVTFSLQIVDQIDLGPVNCSAKIHCTAIFYPGKWWTFKVVGLLTPILPLSFVPVCRWKVWSAQNVFPKVIIFLSHEAKLLGLSMHLSLPVR